MIILSNVRTIQTIKNSINTSLRNETGQFTKQQCMEYYDFKQADILFGVPIHIDRTTKKKLGYLGNVLNGIAKPQFVPEMMNQARLDNLTIIYLTEQQ